MTMPSETTDFFGELEEAPSMLIKRLIKRWFRPLALYSLTGFVLLITNFPKSPTRLINANVANPSAQAALHAPIHVIQFVLAALIGPSSREFFVRAMTCSFVVLWLLLLLLAVFSVRRRGIRMFAYGLGGIVAGYSALHVIAWAAVAVVVAVKGAIFVVRWVELSLAAIVGFVFHYTWPILAVGGALYLAFRARDQLTHGLRWLLLMIRKYARHILGTALVAGLLWLIVPAIYRWVILPIFSLLKWLLMPIAQAIAFFAAWIISFVLVAVFTTLVVATVLLSLALLGSLLVTLLQAGWHAARSLRHILIAGFGIGSTLALIVLVSVATPSVADGLNHAWINALAVLHLANTHATTHFVTTAFRFLLPQSVEDFVFSQLTDLQAPALDSFIFLAVTSLASLSLLFRVFSTRPIEDEYVPIPLVASEYAAMIGGLFVALVVIFFSAESGDSHTS
jgi:hypothetical protein